MQKTLRSVLVALLVAMLTFSPATACHYCGGGYYGYYETSWSESDCSDCGYSESCCGGEVVVSDSGDGYGGCGDCRCEGTVQEEASSQLDPPTAAPEPPMHVETPSTVNMHPTEPAPSLPPQQMLPADDAGLQALPPVVPAVEEPAPATEDTTAPPSNTMDDLFGTPAVPPAEETTPPAVQPADDLFGAPAEETTTPAAEPSTPAAEDDFFGGTEESANETESSTPAETPAAEPTGDDLFGPPADETTPPAEEEAAPADEKADDNDDLFGDARSVLEMTGGLASKELRRWVDNTGDYSCQGRLEGVLDGKVQLRKDNGRTTTVSFDRLSKADLEFVHRQASAQRADAIAKTAQVAPF